MDRIPCMVSAFIGFVIGIWVCVLADILVVKHEGQEPRADTCETRLGHCRDGTDHAYHLLERCWEHAPLVDAGAP